MDKLFNTGGYDSYPVFIVLGLRGYPDLHIFTSRSLVSRYVRIYVSKCINTNEPAFVLNLPSIAENSILELFNTSILRYLDT